MVSIGKIKAVLTGKAKPYAYGAVSAIDKQVQQSRQTADVEGFVNDEQGDKRVHGGPDQAIHVYPFEHYQKWIEVLGPKPLFNKLGAFGENISSTGLDEFAICIADKLQIGTTIVEISQGRMPCWKLNVRCDEPDMSLRFQDTLRTGWYLSVLTPGDIGQDDDIILLERPYPDWSIGRISQTVFSASLDKAELTQMAKLPLKPSWQKIVQRRLENNQVENWTGRLYGPTKT